MSEWLKQNAWALIIGLATLASTYTLYGYRLDQVEKHQAQIDNTILALTSSGVTTQISLAKISTDIEYIKLQLGKLVK